MEYATDLAYAVRARSGLDQTPVGDSPASLIGPKMAPSPSSAQSTIVGTGAHGEWLEVSVTSASSGPRPALPYSARCRTDRAYWSGMVDQLNFGPRYPKSSAVYTSS